MKQIKNKDSKIEQTIKNTVHYTDIIERAVLKT